MSNPIIIYTPSSARQLIEKLSVSNPGFRPPKSGETTSFGRPVVRLDYKPLKIEIKGKLTYGPEKMDPFKGTRKNYTIGVTFEEEDLEVLDKSIALLGEHLKSSNGWQQKSPHEAGQIYFKLPTDKNDSVFTIETNSKISPENIDMEDEVIKNSKNVVMVTFAVDAWAMKDVDSEGAKKWMFGLTLKLLKLQFGKGAPKRKAPESETEGVVKKPRAKPKPRAKKVVEKVSESVASDEDEDEGDEE